MREVLKFIGQLLIIIAVAAGALMLALWIATAITNAEESQNKAEQQVGYSKGYTEGYCAALGGTVLNADTCNVAGKVVEVVRP